MKENNGMKTPMNKTLKLALVSISIYALLSVLVLATSFNDDITTLNLQFLSLWIFVGLPVTMICSICAVRGAFKKPVKEDDVQPSRTVKVVSVISVLLPGIPLLLIFAACLYGLFNLITGEFN